MRDTYFDAVAEFFRRNGVQLALGLLGFIFLFKLGEAFLGRMVIRFYIEVGFSNAEIGTYSKGLGWVVTMVCAAGRRADDRAFRRSPGTVAWRASRWRPRISCSPGSRSSGRTPAYLAYAVVADGVTSAFSTVAFVAFISHYTSRLHTAAQYGALASIGNSGRTVLAASSGVVIDALGGAWASFFVITALMVTPSLGILVWIGRRIAVTRGHAPSSGANLTNHIQGNQRHGIN